MFCDEKQAEEVSEEDRHADLLLAIIYQALHDLGEPLQNEDAVNFFEEGRAALYSDAATGKTIHVERGALRTMSRELVAARMAVGASKDKKLVKKYTHLRSNYAKMLRLIKDLVEFKGLDYEWVMACRRGKRQIEEIIEATTPEWRGGKSLVKTERGRTKTWRGNVPSVTGKTRGEL